MLACDTWLSADFLLRRGFTITDPGDGRHRIAERPGYAAVIEPACTHPDCPPHDHPGYRRLTDGDPMEFDPASRQGRLAALDQLVTATAAGIRPEDRTWCAHDFWHQHIAQLVDRVTPTPDPSVVDALFAKLPACRRVTRCRSAADGWDVLGEDAAA